MTSARSAKPAAQSFRRRAKRYAINRRSIARNRAKAQMTLANLGQSDKLVPRKDKNWFRISCPKGACLFKGGK